MNNNEIKQQLLDGLTALQLSLDPVAQQKLLQFLELLQKWNRHYNLTAITDWPKMVSHHLLDSLAAAPFITGHNILDVGSGAGLPGIPLAVYYPEKQWTLIDSNGKKTRFLIHAKSELLLPNVTVIHERVEHWQSEQKFDVIITRAVGAIKDIMYQTCRHLQPGGQWLFLKGRHPSEEVAGLQPTPVSHILKVPGVTTPRHLMMVSGLTKSC